MHTSTMFEPGLNSIPQTQASSSLLVTESPPCSMSARRQRNSSLVKATGPVPLSATSRPASRVSSPTCMISLRNALSRNLARTRAVSSARENGLVR